MGIKIEYEVKLLTPVNTAETGIIGKKIEEIRMVNRIFQQNI